MVLAPAVSFRLYDMIASCREEWTACSGLDRIRVMCLQSVRIQLCVEAVSSFVPSWPWQYQPVLLHFCLVGRGVRAYIL